MKRYALVAILPLLLAAALASACGGGATPSAPDDGGASFEELRDTLRDRLDAIGVNIGAVPDDVRDQILAECRKLEQFVDEERVQGICGAIEQAIQQGDPGLIDLVLEELAALTAD